VISEPDEQVKLQCERCRHRTMSGCRAFPFGIPEALQEGWIDHRLPYPGDRGYRYETSADGAGRVLWSSSIIRA
jgi:hypothetical protein